MTDSIDKTALSALLDSIGGDRDFLAELIKTFFQDTPEQFAVLHASLADGSADNFRRAAHSLKSNAASFGAMTLSAQCKQLEDMGKAGDLAGAPGLLADAEAEYERVRHALQAVVSRGES